MPPGPFPNKRVAASKSSSLNCSTCCPSTVTILEPASAFNCVLMPSIKEYNSPDIFFACSAFAFHIFAFSAVTGSATFACNDLYNVSFAEERLLFEVVKLLSTTLNAFNISDETFSARSAVSTKYIMLIIFCLGSFGKAITYSINIFIKCCFGKIYEANLIICPA